MRILHVISVFYPAYEYGGPGLGCYEICKRLLKEGHYVEVWTTDALNKTQRVEKEQDVIDGINVKYFRNLSNFLSWRRIFIPTLLSQYAWKHLDSFDVVHLHETRNFLVSKVSRICIKKKIPYCITGHGGVEIIVSRKLLKKIFDIFMGNRILQKAKKCHASTLHEKEQFMRLKVAEEKILVIPIPPSEIIDEISFKDNVYERYSISPMAKIILYLGRLNYKKGLDILLRAFSIVAKQNLDAHLVLAGPDDGILNEILSVISKNSLQKRISIIGPVFGRKKYSIMNNAYMFALTSRDEGLPLTVLEAASLGLPVVCTRETRVPEITEYQAGIETSQEPSEIADAMLLLLSNENLRNEYSRNAKVMIKEKFTWDKVIKRFEAIYRECISKK